MPMFKALRLVLSGRFSPSSLLSTIRLRKRGVPILVYKGSRVRMHKTAVCTGDGGHLALGFRSPVTSSQQTELNLGKDSTLRVRGEFKIYAGCKVHIGSGATVDIGSGFINEGCYILVRKGLVIGNRVAIGPRVTILDADWHVLVNSPRPQSSQVRIGDHVWIGVNSTILKGVTIGDGAVVGANSVVTRDVPAGSLVVGAPARVVRDAA